MEENRKGPGIFYAVVGIATLVVAIIGATFAYFSATATSGEGEITGGTADLSSGALSVTAEQVVFNGTTAANNKLVPAVMPEGITGIQGALNAKCENGGYTGCHVWRITVNTTEPLTAATVTLDLSVNAATKTNWKYALFTSTETTTEVEEATMTTGFSQSALLTTLAEPTVATGDLTEDLSIDLNNGLRLGAGSLEGTPSKVVYLMVYLENVEGVQNATGADQTGTNETGVYTGTVTLDAAGAQGGVKATFTAAQS